MGFLEDHLDREFALRRMPALRLHESSEVIPSSFNKEGKALSWVTPESQLCKCCKGSTIRCPKKCEVQVVQLTGMNQRYVKVLQQDKGIHPLRRTGSDDLIDEGDIWQPINVT